MKNLIKPLFVSLAVAFLAACQTTTSAPIDGIVGLHEVEVEIISVTPEMDGNTVIVRDESGKLYTAVFSISNLGPNSTFDFDHLQAGNRMIVTGEIWSLGEETRLTVRDAKAI